ncbi:MAG: hypothetical protein LBO06_05510 [Bacteroidales bacterium]|jgi:hypothetical protein|nr:hypothetical protein [Bacteroidales bacterium]
MSIDFYKALEISGIGLACLFIFMAIFFLFIVGIDKMFPFKKEADDK